MQLTQTVAEAMPEPEQQPESIVEVGREPYMVMRSGAGTGGISNYESKAVEIVRYSDGSMAYGCKFCDYVSDSARSTSVHTGARHKGQGTPDFLLERQGKQEKKAVTDQSQEKAVPKAVTQVAGPNPADLRGVPLLTFHLRKALSHSDQARDIAVEMISLDFDTRARLAHVILMGKDSEIIREAAGARIAEAEEDRDKWKAEAERLQQWKTNFQDLLTQP